MNVLLVYANRPRLTFGLLPGPYGLELLRARLARSGISATIVNPFLSPEPGRALEESIRDDTLAIGISMRNMDDALVLWDPQRAAGRLQTASCVDDTRDIIEWCHAVAPDVPIVLGGAPIMHMGEPLLAYLRNGANVYADSVEDFVRRVLAAARARGMRPRDGASALLPAGPPAREDLYFRFRGEAAVRSFAGCPLACAHCIEHVAERRIQCEDVAHVATEAEAAVEAHSKIKRIFFADSEVNLAGERRTRALIDEMRGRAPLRDIPLAGYFNPRPMSFALLSFLAERNVKVLMTVDHVADTILARNGKNFRKRHLKEIVASYAALRMELSFCLLLGQPGETKETVDEVLDFVNDLPEEIRGPIYFSPGVRVYPGTPIERGLREGRLDKRWLVGEIDPLHPFISPVVYCESWDPFELYEYVSTRGGEHFRPMNSYMCDIAGEDMNVLQREFRDFHIGMAQMDGDPQSALRVWSDIRSDTPFLTPRMRVDFLWERGRLGLAGGQPQAALSDWLQLRGLLSRLDVFGVGAAKLTHNIGIAEQMALAC
jgi:hypothetical protein